MTRVRRAAWGALVCLVVALPACGGGGGGPEPAATANGSVGVGTASPSAGGSGTPGATVTPVEPTPSGSRDQGPGGGTPPLGTPTATPRPTMPPTAAGLPARLVGKDVERVPTDRKVVALTFDGGGNADGAASVLATLARENITATFFLTGGFADKFPSTAADIAARGHRLGNHSVTHPYFTKLTAADIRNEVLGAARSIQAASGRDPAPFFRFPFGDRDQRTIEVLNGLGYVPIRWTVDTVGWKGTSGGASVESVTTRVLNALGPGEIVLMHLGSHPEDRSTLDADALPGLITALRDRGYGFVTLDALLE
ncbi:polysaccharide deacetylase family protein [Frankia sp. CNm7]|uniref:Polysaccharide deacetylase family protein n=1 Tax=Frankia nepalensis TaxID=1836974 RepID=A0A937UQF7_9ACTN|nr:polysaccharide deacetylase family protein [Frankia nepalensis]MBL7501213.1 polysaccharide deacetylase family protein [Frankia nepalensis]MBL7513512.1 polysaccharide deacetylase family protein [Frankia nepalensis]MBL7524132.1 polysaccharide deacetylase family protein [Frankia nepalensis]MBL7628215.1 polysaccharide deacetylase family protein [Frankia nepalensis]